MFHFIDKDGSRKAEHFSIEQGIVDRQVLAEFSDIESNVANGAEAPTIESDAPILKKIDLLPTQRALHWRGELRRVGVVIRAKKETTKAAEAGAKIHAANNLGGSK